MLLPETIALHDQQRFEFHCIYFLPWKNQMVSAIESNGGKVKCIPAKNNFKIVLCAGKVAHYIRQHNIDIVHCHLPWAGITGRLAGKFAHVPVIYTEHNKWERYHKLTFTLNKLTFPMQQLVVAVSKDVKASIAKHYHKMKPAVETVLNGVNTDKFDPVKEFQPDIRHQLNIPAQAKVIGIISVFRVQKRLTAWLQIAHDLHQKFPDTYFIIVGDGPLKDELHTKAIELNMSAYLHFAGLQQEVRPYFDAMDIFMMSSVFEGLPIALLEAMSMECIPCCTKAGGIAEVIEDGNNGFLVNVDEPMQLVEKVSSLLQKWDEQAPRLKRNARSSVQQNFSLQRMVNQIENIYEETLRKQSA